MEHYSTMKKERNQAICSNMNESGGHYAKENKLVIEGKK
jgi:hypothetical protein